MKKKIIKKKMEGIELTEAASVSACYISIFLESKWRKIWFFFYLKKMKYLTRRKYKTVFERSLDL